MKKLINTINNEEAAAKIIGAVVNFAIAAAGAVFCLYGIYLQVTGKLL